MKLKRHLSPLSMDFLLIFKDSEPSYFAFQVYIRQVKPKPLVKPFFSANTKAMYCALLSKSSRGRTQGVCVKELVVYKLLLYALPFVSHNNF